MSSQKYPASLLQGTSGGRSVGPAKVKMAIVAQLVRAPDCDSGGRGFEPHHSPEKKPSRQNGVALFFYPFTADSPLLNEKHSLLLMQSGNSVIRLIKPCCRMDHTHLPSCMYFRPLFISIHIISSLYDQRLYIV